MAEKKEKDKIVKLPESAHHDAKVRAAQEKKTLKEYLADLVKEDVKK